MWLVAATAALALVAQDHVPLKAAPRDAAAQQALLWSGELLEVRGERMDYLQVYDHRLERAGYVRATQVRPISTESSDAPALLSIVRFLRDAPGQEALGIAYAAAYLKAAPAASIDAEPLDALATMAERLAKRATARQGKFDEENTAAQLEVAGSYGAHFVSIEHPNGVQLCYDGDADRQVLALKATPLQRAHAALAITREDCIDPDQAPAATFAFDQWRARVLEGIDLRDLPTVLRNRLEFRRAGVDAGLAFEMTRRSIDATSIENRALAELAAVDKAELEDDDSAPYAEAAIRVSASRWAAEPVPAVTPPSTNTLPHLATAPGEPGQTCVLLIDATHAAEAPLLKHCTYGLVWLASATATIKGDVMTLAVQPLPTWRELWVIQQQEGHWTVSVLPPSDSDPDIGYAEFSGWIPSANKVLVTRESKSDGHWKRSFEIVRLDTLAVDNHADRPESLSLFYRWQSPAWRGQTLSLR